LASIFDKVQSRLESTPDLSILAVSRSFRSPAWPPGSGPEFLNAALSIDSVYQARALLTILHNIENRLGRSRAARWGPRVCDLDLVMHGDEIHPDASTVRRWMALDEADAARLTPDRLLAPHPRLHQRGFVLLPLMDIAPDRRHPILGRTVREMAADLPAHAVEGVEPL